MVRSAQLCSAPADTSRKRAEGSTSATILASFFGTDHIAFQVHWDAYGFPGVTRSYDSFSAAQTEEGRSRVYGGIHYTFDVTAGWELGRSVGDYIFGHFLLPVSEGDDGGEDGAFRSSRAGQSEKAPESMRSDIQLLAAFQGTGHSGESSSLASMPASSTTP